MNADYTHTMKSMMSHRELASPLSEVMGVMVISAIVLYGGKLILDHNSALTASQFMGYLGLYFSILGPAKNIGNAISSLQRGLVSGERVFQIIDEPEIEQGFKLTDTGRPRDGQAMIKWAFMQHREFKVLIGRLEEVSRVGWWSGSGIENCIFIPEQFILIHAGKAKSTHTDQYIQLLALHLDTPHEIIQTAVSTMGLALTHYAPRHLAL